MIENVGTGTRKALNPDDYHVCETSLSLCGLSSDHDRTRAQNGGGGGGISNRLCICQLTSCPCPKVSFHTRQSSVLPSLTWQTNQCRHARPHSQRLAKANLFPGPTPRSDLDCDWRGGLAVEHAESTVCTLESATIWSYALGLGANARSQVEPVPVRNLFLFPVDDAFCSLRIHHGQDNFVPFVKENCAFLSPRF